MEDYDTARRELERAVAVARDKARQRPPHALSALAELEFRVGDWTTARALAEEALRLTEDADQFCISRNELLRSTPYRRATAHTPTPTSVERRRSQREPVAGDVRSRRPRAARVRPRPPGGRDRPPSRTRELAERIGIGEPNIVQWMPDLIESQIRAGLEPDARRHWPSSRPRRSGPAAAGRSLPPRAAAGCRPAGDGRRDLHRGASARRRAPSPFERARTELCWASGYDVTAAESTRAGSYTTRSRAFKRSARPHGRRRPRASCAPAAAEPSADRVPEARADPQQMQIATMVAEGRTNKSVANALFLSPKTIEFHLGHVYRKLDVNNRTQLARALFSPLPAVLAVMNEGSPRRERAVCAARVVAPSSGATQTAIALRLQKGDRMTFQRSILTVVAIAPSAGSRSSVVATDAHASSYDARSTVARTAIAHMASFCGLPKFGEFTAWSAPVNIGPSDQHAL